MKRFIIILFLAVHASAEDDIFRHHEAFRCLIAHSEQLTAISREVSIISKTLEVEMEVIAAAEARASADLLSICTQLLLLQHASLVDAFGKTQYFSSRHLTPAIEILRRQAAQAVKRSQKLKNAVRTPTLFQQILNLESVASGIDHKMSKLLEATNPTDTEKSEILLDNESSLTH